MQKHGSVFRMKTHSGLQHMHVEYWFTKDTIDSIECKNKNERTKK